MALQDVGQCAQRLVDTLPRSASSGEQGREAIHCKYCVISYPPRPSPSLLPSPCLAPPRDPVMVQQELERIRVSCTTLGEMKKRLLLPFIASVLASLSSFSAKADGVQADG